MKLHKDIDAFKVLLNEIHEKTGYRLDVLEKDYYVVLILKGLSIKQSEGLPAYFKGGTALNKALHTTNRFSEDIDISVETRGCSRTQNDKRLDDATKKYTSLDRDVTQGITNRSEVIADYTYIPLADYDANDALQRFGKLKLEATSFTISELINSMEISPMLYELASSAQKKILNNLYDIKPFSIQTITLERIFIDKLFAAEAYIRKSEFKNKAFEAAKHIYDLAIMAKLPLILDLLTNENELDKLLSIRMKEENNRLNGIPGLMPNDFILFDNIKTNELVKEAYEIMQRQYVLRETDRITYKDATIILQNMHDILVKNNAWNSKTTSTSFKNF